MTHHELCLAQPVRIEYTADGSRLVVGSDDRATVWNYDIDTWLDLACKVAGRNLTRDEWDLLGPRTIGYRASCDQFPIESGRVVAALRVADR